jgi:hypothetical protein
MSQPLRNKRLTPKIRDGRNSGILTQRRQFCKHLPPVRRDKRKPWPEFHAPAPHSRCLSAVKTAINPSSWFQFRQLSKRSSSTKVLALKRFLVAKTPEYSRWCSVPKFCQPKTVQPVLQTSAVGKTLLTLVLGPLTFQSRNHANWAARAALWDGSFVLLDTVSASTRSVDHCRPIVIPSRVAVTHLPLRRPPFGRPTKAGGLLDHEVLKQRRTLAC